MSQPICPYCKSEIRPLDVHRQHVALENDKDGIPKSWIVVTCVLKRAVDLMVRPVDD